MKNRTAALLSCALLSTPVLAQTDDCASATSIAGYGTYSFDSSTATTDGVANIVCMASSNSQIEKDVWWCWSALADAEVIVSTCAQTAVDTRIAIYDGCGPCPEANGIVACDDDSCSFQSSVMFQATAGQTYLIRVGSFPGFAGGLGAIEISENLVGTGGPDVIVGDLPNTSHYGPVGGIHAYSVGTTSCNVGGQDLLWISGTNEHPVIAQNMYKLADGRFEQIGLSWLKHGFFALTGTLCSQCNGNGGSVLGVGCSDPYGSGLNGIQSGLGPRFEVNATTGVFDYPWSNPAGEEGDDIFKRIQVAESDLTDPDARYYVEGHYITQDDAQADNGLNNASYRRVSVNTDFSLTLRGVVRREKPAIMAWSDFDDDVDLAEADYIESGVTARFYVASKVVDLGDGTWSYEYAIQNLNSHRSGGWVSIPVGLGTLLSSVGFHDVNYHSGEPFDGTDWTGIPGGGIVSWSCPQDFATNPDANALRWGTLYNYRFVANTPPTTGDLTIGLFRPGSAGDPDQAVATTQVPSERCLVDWDNNGIPSTADFLAYLNDYNAARTGGTPTHGDPDLAAPLGILNTADFLAFLNLINAGC